MTRPGRLLVATLLCSAGCARGLPPLPLPQVAPITSPRPQVRQLPWREVQHLPLYVGTQVCAGGDVMLGSNLDTAWALAAQRLTGSATLLPDPDSLLAPLAPLVAEADLLLLNVEGAIGDGPFPGKCRPGSTRCYQFRQNPTVAAALRRLLPGGAVVGNVANNHARDAGAAGFEETVTHLAAAGVAVTGADTLATAVPVASGDTVGVLGFSTFTGGPDARDLEAVRRHVARAAARYGRVVVSVHMAAEGVGAQRTRDVIEMFLGENRGNPVAFARAAVEAGAAIVVGHGPHVLRAIEWRGDALVVYSLGNLVTYGPFSRVEPLNRGAVVCALLDRRGRVVDGVVQSTMQVRPGVAFPDVTGRAAGLIDSLSALDFPTTGVRLLDGRILRR